MKSKFHPGFWWIWFMLFPPILCQGQTPEIIHIKNPSFDAPTKYFILPPGWTPHAIFLGAEKIKDLKLTRFYRKEERSNKGSSHIALACYINGTRENVGQKLKFPMIPGHVYTMDVWLAFNPIRTSVHPSQRVPVWEDNLEPAKLQLFGFHSEKDLSNSILAETGPVDHTGWRKYTLEWVSSGKYQYIYFVSTWAGEGYYNGNLLLDNVSDIHVSIRESGQ